MSLGTPMCYVNVILSNVLFQKSFTSTSIAMSQQLANTMMTMLIVGRYLTNAEVSESRNDEFFGCQSEQYV